jgi:two-component system response regulator (stage 0 sporulation protein F)
MVCVRRSVVKATVLVVDDSPEIQRYLRTLLELDSYRVVAVSNGYEALEILRHAQVADVVLLDMQMPGMDGLEVLRRMQNLCPKVKVIMCSGVNDPEKICQALSLGAHAYLVKPVQHLYLSAAVERCLQNVPATRSRENRASQLFVMPSPVCAEHATLLPNLKS